MNVQIFKPAIRYLDLLSFRFFENGINLYYKTSQYQNRSDGYPGGAINLIFIKHCRIVAATARHQEHANGDYQGANAHPDIIIL